MEASSGAEPIYQGRLGRTSKTSVLISSQAGPVFPASVYTGLNVTEDPALRQQLAEGALNHIECPFTPGRVYALAIPLRYHDPSQHVFALIVPEALRHEEFKHRSELLQELAKEREVLPEYVRHFHVVFSLEELDALIARAKPAAPAPSAADELAGPTDETGRLDLSVAMSSLGPVVNKTIPGPPSVDVNSQLEQLSSQRQELEHQRHDLESQRHELTQARDMLTMEQRQLSEVSDRLERERERMDQIEVKNVAERQRLESERMELEALRAEIEDQRLKLQARELNLEQERLRLASQPELAGPEEKTQVVTDDQFIEIMGGSGSPAEADSEHDMLLDEKEILGQSAEFSEPSPMSSALLREVRLEESGEHLGPDEMTFITSVPSLDHAPAPPRFDAQLGGGQDYYAASIQDHVLAARRLTKKQLDSLFAQGQDPAFFIQYAVVENYPLITLLLASLDENQQAQQTLGWPLDISVERDQAVINALTKRAAVRFAFYEPSGKLLRTYDVQAELTANVKWIKDKADAYWSDPKRKSGRFGKAAEVFMAPDHERLGSMRHPFNPTSFDTIERPSQAKLAAGIVGYWSGGDVFEYLIANRAFPLATFEQIQARVVERSTYFGIYLNAALRQRALALSLAKDERALTRILLANFAEVSAGLRPNDLDPVEQWENWDVLLNLCSEIGLQPDDEVVKLAQASLERAQQYEDSLDGQPEEDEDDVEFSELGDDDYELEEASPQENTVVMKVPQPADGQIAEELIVARRSESTGVTYFLPDSAIEDTFEDLATMSREDLLLLLEDAKARLEAAQMLVERFGAQAINEVLAKAEHMQAPEIAAMAKFLESKADGLEGALVRALESAGPGATYIIAHALSSVGSTSAIPSLIKALRDPQRQGNKDALARTLALYGDKLVPQLMSVIKRDGHDDATALLLAALERQDKGFLNRLSKDRHGKIRAAAVSARSFL